MNAGTPVNRRRTPLRPVSDERADSMIALLALGATQGHVLRVRAEGPDASAAVDAIADLVEDGFGEGE